MYHITHKYMPFSIDSALETLNKATTKVNKGSHLAKLSDVGRRLEGHIVFNCYKETEFNIWHELEYIKNLLK